MLILSRKVGQTLVIGGNIELVITEISGDKVKLGIAAPKEVTILRKELCQVVEANRQAVQDVPDSTLRLLAASLRPTPLS